MQIDTVQRLIRLQRRFALEARTLAVTLHGAIDDLRRIQGVPESEQTRLRREWCERTSVQLQDVAAKSAQLRLMTSGAARKAAIDDLEDAYRDLRSATRAAGKELERANQRIREDADSAAFRTDVHIVA